MKIMEENSHSKRPLWGILGGMGPLSSAEFLSNVYRMGLCQTGKEQEMPRMVLVSDPDIPDRTAAIAALSEMKPRQYEEIKRRLKQLLEQLWSLRVDRIVIPCVTAHFFLPHLDLPTEIESRICSLVSVMHNALSAARGKYILLRTNGTREARIFENHPAWREVSERIQPIEDPDQERIHWKYLYKLKKDHVQAEDLDILLYLRHKYKVEGFAAGCTEVHLHTRQLAAQGIPVIDPLMIIAQEIAGPPSQEDRGLISSDISAGIFSKGA